MITLVICGSRTGNTVLEEVQKLQSKLLFRWGGVFLERTRILSGIQFTKYFILFVVVKTKQYVSSNVNAVILTRQTCPRTALEHVCWK